MKHILAIAAMLVIAFSSCKKDKDEVPASPTPTTSTPSVASYTRLAIGNYWIYGEFTVDTLGNATYTGRMDSCYVEKDTTINSNTYHKLVKNTSIPFFNILFLRDSSNCVVDEYGKICFSMTDFTTHFNHTFRYDPAPPNDTIYESWSQMYNETSGVITPAGTFNVLNHKTVYKLHGAYASVVGEYRYMDSKYCDNTGLVLQTLPLFLSNPYHTEIRLMRYHLN
jgi:hypothetical protein